MPYGASARVAVVDDDPGVRSTVSEYLARDGYEVGCCANGAELDELVDAAMPDLVLLDLSMPGEDGISIARRLQSAHPVPIIMLTALDDIVNRVVGLAVGADDYVTKPFDLRELGARVHAVLRRARKSAEGLAGRPGAGRSRKVVCFGNAFLDLEGRRLLDRDGARLPMTSGEFDLLATFAQHPNEVLSRDRLLAGETDISSASGDRAIDVRVTRLRKRVETDPAKPRVIRTVRSVGYVYVPPA